MQDVPGDGYRYVGGMVDTVVIGGAVPRHVNGYHDAHRGQISVNVVELVTAQTKTEEQRVLDPVQTASLLTRIMD